MNISMNMSEPGKAWYLVVPDASAAPTAQVVDQVSVYGGVTVVKKGSWTVPTADTDADVAVTGLDDETAFSAYVVVQDEGDADTATNKYVKLASRRGVRDSRAVHRARRIAARVRGRRAAGGVRREQHVVLARRATRRGGEGVLPGGEEDDGFGSPRRRRRRRFSPAPSRARWRAVTWTSPPARPPPARSSRTR